MPRLLQRPVILPAKLLQRPGIPFVQRVAVSNRRLGRRLALAAVTVTALAITVPRFAEVAQQVMRPARRTHRELQNLLDSLHIPRLVCVDYLRPAIGPLFRCEAEVMRLGSRVANTRMAFTDEQGRLLATGAAAYIVS